METFDKRALKSSDLTKTKEYFEQLLDPDWEDPVVKFLKACPVTNDIIQVPIDLNED